MQTPKKKRKKKMQPVLKHEENQSRVTAQLHNGGWMYSDARSRIFGNVQSLLVELSGVGGGSDPMLGVKLAETGAANGAIVALPGAAAGCM